MSHDSLPVSLVLSFALSSFGGTAAVAQIHPSHQVIVATDQGANNGVLTVVETASPWPVTPAAASSSPDSIVHCFQGQLYVLGRRKGIVQVRALPNLKLLAEFSLPKVRAPRDLVMVGSRMALISDHDSVHLWWLDTWTGDVKAGPDLGAYADSDGLPDVECMTLVGSHVYVQMQRYDRDGYLEHGAKLAVLGPAFHPLEPAVLEGVIDLQGFRPQYRMQANAAGNRLWVSAPGVNDDWDFGNRGIEEIDLTTGTSIGFVMTENQFSADMGPFVMLDDDKGFAIVHTSIVASTHLRVFHRAVGQIAELHVSITGRLDTIALDRVRRQVFYPIPQGGSPSGGLLVFDADNNTQLSGLLGVGGEPVDMIVVQ